MNFYRALKFVTSLKENKGRETTEDDPRPARQKRSQNIRWSVDPLVI